EVPVSPSVKACFKRAGEARIAYIQSYGSQPSTAPAPNSQPGAAQDRIGPSFDCAKDARTPLTLMICADPELSRVDLAFNQAYWALHHFLDAPKRKWLSDEDNQFLGEVLDDCQIPRSGGLTQEAWRARDCVKEAYEQTRNEWIGELDGAAREEATRPLG